MGSVWLLTDEGKNVTIWNVSTSKLVRAFKHDGPERRLGTCAQPGWEMVRLQGPGRGIEGVGRGQGRRIPHVPGTPRSRWFSFSPDNARLAAADNSGVVKTWDLATGRELCADRAAEGFIRKICFSHDGKRLAAPMLRWRGAYSRCGKRPRGLAASQGFQHFPT